MYKLLVIGLLIGSISNAAEIRMLKDMPTSGKTKSIALVKSKKAGYQCQWVKIGENGNPVKVAGSRGYWFETVSNADEKAASALLGDGKKAVRCTLKQYDEDRNKMRNASGIDEES